MAYNIEPVVDIDINNLFFQLHQTALQEAQKAVGDKVDVINLGVDPKNKSFVGSGDFIVVAQNNKKDITDFPKNKPDEFFNTCKDALCTYMKYFAGNDIAKKLESDNSLFNRIDDPTPVPESVASYSLSRLMLEKAESTKRSGIGYYVEYGIQIQGQKKHQWHDLRSKFENALAGKVFSALKNVTVGAAKGIFGSTFKELASFKMDIGGKTYQVGRAVASKLKKVATGIKNTVVVAGQKLKKVFGKTDLSELDKNFEAELNSEFPNNKSKPNIAKVDTLLINLRKAKKLSSDILKKLSENGVYWRMEYVITLEVTTTDSNYEQYNIDNLYKCFTNALKETKSMSALRDLTSGAFNTFSKSNIIKIDDYTTGLGVVRLRNKANSIESVRIKKQFLSLVLEHNIYLLEDAETDDAEKLLRDWFFADGSSSTIDANRVARLKNYIQKFDVNEFKSTLKVPQYSTRAKYAAAIEEIDNREKLDDFISKLKAAGGLVNLVDELKSSSIIKKSRKDGKKYNEDEQHDLYIFCLANVVRQNDEKQKDKKKGE